MGKTLLKTVMKYCRMQRAVMTGNHLHNDETLQVYLQVFNVSSLGKPGEDPSLILPTFTAAFLNQLHLPPL
jgi:hypothetical protein